jgi:hypothetical protein
MRAAALLLASTLALGATAVAQPRGGVLRVHLTDGTNGGIGSAEKATLIKLEAGMVPVKEVENVSGTFEISGVEVEGERPMLLQVTSKGVHYNEPIRFGRGYEAEADITVYDVLSKWNDRDMELKTQRTLFRREGDKLLVDEVYVVENRTSPPRTYFDPDGSFRFSLPTKDLRELRSVSARGKSGMPVPQQASPLPDGTGYVTKTAFKPGETELVVSYEVGYGADGYHLSARAFYPIDEVYVFVAPPDIDIDASGWENLGPEPEGRFVAVRKRNLSPGDPLELALSGGSDSVASAPAAENPRPTGQVTILPDSGRFSKAVLVVLMAAALGYGLLSVLYPPSARESSRTSRG